VRLLRRKGYTDRKGRISRRASWANVVNLGSTHVCSHQKPALAYEAGVFIAVYPTNALCHKSRGVSEDARPKITTCLARSTASDRIISVLSAYAKELPCHVRKRPEPEVPACQLFCRSWSIGGHNADIA
jgi:hypothetical protein